MNTEGLKISEPDTDRVDGKIKGTINVVSYNLSSFPILVPSQKIMVKALYPGGHYMVSPYGTIL